MHGVIFWKHHNGVLLRCLELLDLERVLRYLHDGPIGGHIKGNTTADKVIRVNYYWPSLFKDAHADAWKCLVCQRCASCDQSLVAPFIPIVVEEPFQ